MSQAEVLIVGAGPSGLAMAIELLRFGISFRLIDRAMQPAQWSQALVVHARTLEQFERYGIAYEAVSTGRPIYAADIFSQQRQILHIPFGEIPSNYPYVLMLGQNDTERILNAHLEQLGGFVERGYELLGFQLIPQGVTATIKTPDGQEETQRFRWIVGCDGARSRVRSLLNQPFRGGRLAHNFFLGDVELQSNDFPQDRLRVYLDHGHVLFMTRLAGQQYRLIMSLPPNQHPELQNYNQPLNIEDFQRLSELISGRSLGIHKLTWSSFFPVHYRQVDSYCFGNAFLVGDAAHIHSPLAGQGMNTGLQDAANLAWKLAAVYHGAPEHILTSYTDERHEVGKQVVQRTTQGMNIGLSQNPLIIALRDTFAPYVTRIRPIRRILLGFVSETAINYRKSKIVRDCGGASAYKAGDRLSDIELLDEQGKTTQLHKLCAAPRHHIIAIDYTDYEFQQLRLHGTRARFIRLSTHNNPQLAKTYGNHGKAIVYCVRPDGYIGFRGTPSDLPELFNYLKQTGNLIYTISSARS